MRTPVLTHTARQDSRLTEELVNGLAELLVAEYRRRHPQRNQQGLSATVASPRRPNGAGADGGDER